MKNQLLSSNLWPSISKLAKKALKRAAIAYVSSDQHIQFTEGDLLICDASLNAIKTGQTSAKVLKRAFDRGAQVFNLPGLHAKILLLNEQAIIGSANCSSSSANDLIEAGLLTDQPTIVSKAQSFVNALATQAQELNDKSLKKLLAIKVIRPPRRAGFKKVEIALTASQRTWIVGSTELRKDFPAEQDAVEDAASQCRELLCNPRSTVTWLRWTGNSSFRKECQQDDWIIQAWRPLGRKIPKLVFESMPVINRLDLDDATYLFYEEFPKAESRAKSWAEFRSLALRAGISRPIKPRSVFQITNNQADAVQALWDDN